MISLTEPVNLSDYFFDDEHIRSFADFEKNFLFDSAEHMFLPVRKNFPYLPSHYSDDAAILWNKLDEFFALDIRNIEKDCCLSLNHELMYYHACSHLNKGLNLLNEFGESLVNAIQTHNPKMLELSLFLAINIKQIHSCHNSVKQVIVPLLVFLYYIYERWDTYSKECLKYINYAVYLKRCSLELDYLALSDANRFDNYFDYQKVRDSFSEAKKQGHIKTQTEITNTVLPDIVRVLFSEAEQNNVAFFTILHNTIHEIKKTQHYPYHDKQYSFGYFDAKGIFFYTGHMNALALILYDVPMKGWSSCGDKVHRFLEYVHVKGKTTTLIKNLEKVSAAKHDFRKKDFHDEAVELFHAIVKNSE